jgi:hypothetical protein
VWPGDGHLTVCFIKVSNFFVFSAVILSPCFGRVEEAKLLPVMLPLLQPWMALG